jgi:hypothetical protein
MANATPTMYRAPNGSLEDAFESCKRRLLSELRGIDHTEALQDYFRLYYPTVEQASMHAPDQPLPQDRARSQGFLRRIDFQAQARQDTKDPSYTANIKKIEWVSRWIEQRLEFGPDSRRFMVHLAVNSKKDPYARITLIRLNGDPVDVVHAPGESIEIYRGLYRYKVEKQRYKTYESDGTPSNPHLNIVDWSWTSLGIMCELIPATQAGAPFPCRPQ